MTFIMKGILWAYLRATDAGPRVLATPLQPASTASLIVMFCIEIHGVGGKLAPAECSIPPSTGRDGDILCPPCVLEPEEPPQGTHRDRDGSDCRHPVHEIRPGESEHFSADSAARMPQQVFRLVSKQLLILSIVSMVCLLLNW